MSWPAFNNEVDMDDSQFKLGMLFRSSEQVANAIKQHTIKHGKQVKFKVCEKTRVRAICR